MSSPTAQRRRPSVRARQVASDPIACPFPAHADPAPEPAQPAATVVDVACSETERRVMELEIEVAQLRTAMSSRATIEQAKGMLMLLTNCGEQVAFDLLAHISSHTHRKVREVAVEIVESAAGHCSLPPDVRAILQDACPPGHPRG